MPINCNRKCFVHATVLISRWWMLKWMWWWMFGECVSVLSDWVDPSVLKSRALFKNSEMSARPRPVVEFRVSEHDGLNPEKIVPIRTESKFEEYIVSQTNTTDGEALCRYSVVEFEPGWSFCMWKNVMNNLWRLVLIPEIDVDAYYHRSWWRNEKQYCNNAFFSSMTGHAYS